MSKRTAFVAAALVAVALSVQAATAAPKKPAKAAGAGMLVGINDEAATLYGNPPEAFAALKSLNVKVLRVNLYWGGTPWAVAKSKPSDATDPGDQAYSWALYDRLARYAETYHIQLMFSILFTPNWANGGKGKNVAPTNPQALQDFAQAAATRYDGFYIPPAWQQQPTLEKPTEPLPAVTLWTAWNEPNNPVFLVPQYAKQGGKWIVASAKSYAQICNAVYKGVHKVTVNAGAVTLLGPKVAEKEQVACGVTDPRGNDNPGARSSIDPLTFLTAAKQFGMGPIDAYAHNPYPSAGTESPTYIPKGATARRVQLGNIGNLISLVTKYYGSKPIWVTEYGYQTNPPNKTVYGTSWQNQAAWLTQSVSMARKNPRIKIFLWYLLKDGPPPGSWQSGLETVTGQKKPAWAAFAKAAKG